MTAPEELGQVPDGQLMVTSFISKPVWSLIQSAPAREIVGKSEAIGRLVSYVLRISSPVEPSERIQEVIRQLNGIGGGRSLGFGPNRVRSLPDGVAQTLAEYLEGRRHRLGRKAGGRRRTPGPQHSARHRSGALHAPRTGWR